MVYAIKHVKYAFYQEDILVQLNPKRNKELDNAHASNGVWFEPVSTYVAKKWVKNGGRNETWLYVNDDGKVKKQ